MSSSLPQLPFASVRECQMMTVHFHPIIALINFAYIATAEATKALLSQDR
jgi:hypothetical protein